MERSKGWAKRSKCLIRQWTVLLALFAGFITQNVNSDASIINQPMKAPTGALRAEKISLEILKAEKLFKGNVKIDETLLPLYRKQLEAGFMNIPILLKLKTQADLSDLQKQTDLTHEQRVSFVYKKLAITAKKTQKDLLKFLNSEELKFRSFHIMNAVAVFNPTPEQIVKLSMREDIFQIQANPSVKFQPTPSTQKMNASSFSASCSNATPGENIEYVGAKRVWSDFGVKGNGIVVAGQDTGVQYDHPALVNQYRGNLGGGKFDHSLSWHDAIHKNEAHSVQESAAAKLPPTAARKNSCGYDLVSPCDDGEHGTHTMGTIVGNGGRLKQIGMAPDAQWIACRNMDEGEGTPATYLECFEYFLAPYAPGNDPKTQGRPDMAPHVINNSWGCPPSEGCKGTEMITALDNMKAAGIMVVVSAGNDGPSCGSAESPPSNYAAGTFSVGAFEHATGYIAKFSNRGLAAYDKGLVPNVVAPGGCDTFSAIPKNNYVSQNWRGTSMAGPHVVGQVALIWSAVPTLIGKLSETMDLIQSTAVPKKANYRCGGEPKDVIPNNTYGYGVIDAYASVKKALGK